MSGKPIVVFDTQVVLRAALNRRSLPAKLLFDLGNLYILAWSPQTFAETKDVLNRPELRAKFPGLTDGRMPLVRVVWRIDNGSEISRFITAYPGA